MLYSRRNPEQKSNGNDDSWVGGKATKYKILSSLMATLFGFQGGVGSIALQTLLGSVCGRRTAKGIATRTCSYGTDRCCGARPDRWSHACLITAAVATSTVAAEVSGTMPCFCNPSQYSLPSRGLNGLKQEAVCKNIGVREKRKRAENRVELFFCACSTTGWGPQHVYIHKNHERSFSQ